MTKRTALVVLALLVVLGAGPGKGCKDTGACATFDGASASGTIFVNVAWTDSVNTTDTYVVEAYQYDGGNLVWEVVSNEVLHVDGDENGAGYAVLVLVDPGAVAVRVVASCGETSDEIPL